MNRFSCCLLIIPVALLAFCSTKPADEHRDATVDTSAVGDVLSVDCTPVGEPFVVMEMFTYEGCHSCAEAEKLFNSLVISARQNPQQPNIIAIAAHISYWNHLEWPDKFGLAICDSIQKRYCQQLNSQTYTPQLIINGQLLGVPEPSFMQQNLLYFLNQLPETALCIEPRERQDSLLTIGYKLSSVPQAGTLVCVLIESGLSSSVTSGDNAGLTLHHEQVARAFTEQNLTEKQGLVKLTVPKNINPKQASVVAYVRNRATMKIIAATKGFNL